MPPIRSAGGNFAKTSADVTEEQFGQSGSAFLDTVKADHAHGSGAGKSVDVPAGLVQSCEGTGGHSAGERGHEDDSGAQSRVDEVLADAAEHLLDDDDGDDRTQDNDPEGDVGGEVVGQEQTGDDSRQVCDGVFLLHCFPGEELSQNAGDDGDEDDRQGTKAEDDDCSDTGGDKGDDDIAHDAGRGVSRLLMRRSADRQFFGIDHFFAPASLMIALPRRMYWTSGRPDGHAKAQLPHSIQVMTLALFRPSTSFR